MAEVVRHTSEARETVSGIASKSSRLPAAASARSTSSCATRSPEGLRLPGQAVEVDVAARDDRCRRAAGELPRVSEQHRERTAEDGSTSTFIRSHITRIAATISASPTVRIAATCRRINAKVSSPSEVRSPSHNRLRVG